MIAARREGEKGRCAPQPRRGADGRGNSGVGAMRTPSEPRGGRLARTRAWRRSASRSSTSSRPTTSRRGRIARERTRSCRSARRAARAPLVETTSGRIQRELAPEQRSIRATTDGARETVEDGRYGDRGDMGITERGTRFTRRASPREQELENVVLVTSAIVARSVRGSRMQPTARCRRFADRTGPRVRVLEARRVWQAIEARVARPDSGHPPEPGPEDRARPDISTNGPRRKILQTCDLSRARERLAGPLETPLRASHDAPCRPVNRTPTIGVERVDRCHPAPRGVTWQPKA